MEGSTFCSFSSREKARETCHPEANGVVFRRTVQREYFERSVAHGARLCASSNLCRSDHRKGSLLGVEGYFAFLAHESRINAPEYDKSTIAPDMLSEMIETGGTLRVKMH